MLLELHQIGQLAVADRAQEASLVLDPAKVKSKVKGVEHPKHQLLPIHFDLDRRVVETLPLERFNNGVRQLWSVGAVRFGAPRGRKHYPAVLFPKNISQWEVSLFGTDEAESDLLQWCGDRADAPLRAALEGVQGLETAYRAWLGEETLFEKLREKSGKAEPVVLIYACVSSEAHAWQKTPLAGIGNYQALYRASRAGETEAGLCYFTGRPSEGVAAPDSTNRFNLNKLFVTTTVNYAPGFEKNNYHHAYQIGPEVFGALEAGSEFLLQQDSPLQLRIAGVSHVVLPRVIGFGADGVLEEASLREYEELNLSLFGYAGFEQMISNMRNAHELFGAQALPFSLTYVAYDSDGNSTKVINVIREVRDWQFRRVLTQLTYLNTLFAPWLTRQGINLLTIFQQLPIIKGTKRNPGLRLLGDILENRAVNEQLIYQYCSETLNCHRYGRYPAYDYPQGNKTDGEPFWEYVRTITQLGALRLLLYRLGQLKADHHLRAGPLTDAAEYDIDQLKQKQKMENSYDAYFQRLGYNTRHQALFFLGRALSSVATAQQRKKNSKTILNALDFSGMDAKKIVNLQTAIMAKAGLYRLETSRYLTVLDMIRHYNDEFSQRFDLPTWERRVTTEAGELAPVTAKEAVFYIMSGYTYGASKKKKTDKASGEEE